MADEEKKTDENVEKKKSKKKGKILGDPVCELIQ